MEYSLKQLALVLINSIIIAMIFRVAKPTTEIQLSIVILMIGILINLIYIGLFLVKKKITDTNRLFFEHNGKKYKILIVNSLPILCEVDKNNKVMVNKSVHEWIKKIYNT